MSEFTFAELLRSAAGDGASVPTRVEPPDLVYEALFEAWSIERGHSIECEILLRLSRAAIAQLLEDGRDVLASGWIDLGDLMQQIDSQLGHYRPRRT